MLDLVIFNGRIIDGTGKRAYDGSIWVKDDKIICCAPASEKLPEAKEVIDAQSNIVCPGFVDTHTHSDLMLLWDRQHSNALQQGVTTEIIGQDGMSYAPLSHGNLLNYSRYAAGCNGVPPIAYDWESVAEYRARFCGCGINTAFLMPHCAVRLETVGMHDGSLNTHQMLFAQTMIAQAMKEGAKGFSTGLSYPPNFFSDTSELTELCKTVALHNGVFAIHLRSVFPKDRFDPVDEALSIAKNSGVKLHFSHFKTGPSTAGHPEVLLKKIDKGIRAGLDISLELYPYAYGASLGQMFLPTWVLTDGLDAAMEILADAGKKCRAVREMDTSGHIPNGVFSHLQVNTEYLGQTFEVTAAQRGQTVSEMLCDILLEEQLCVGFCDRPPENADLIRQLETDILQLLQRDEYMVGSDSIIVGDNPHPRAFGTFPKLLRLARENQFPLELLINRMTEKPCKRFMLANRGSLKYGSFADITIFDDKTVTDTADFAVSRNAPTGIRTVVINGKVAVRNGFVTGILNGRPL